MPQTANLPAPTGGMNALDSMAKMPPEDAVWMVNALPAEYGVRSRFGWREWVTGLTGDADSTVRTVMPFTGADEAGSKLFVTTSSGIWDCTESTDAPSGPAIAFDTTDGDAGRGVCTAFTGVTGDHYLFYADAVNGLYMYSELTGDWTKPTEGTDPGEFDGMDPSSVRFVGAFKDRLWFAVDAESSGYYLEAGAIAGSVDSFNFGAKFRAGGFLVGLYNWTYDGGLGLDDTLCAVSSGGDIVLCQGSDPSVPDDFGVKGVWFCGKPPTGRKVATNFGGDVLLLTRTGIVPLSKLVMGQFQRSQYTTYKITNLFNQLMASYGDDWGWSMCLHPEDASFVVTVPTQGSDANTEQLVMSLTNGGWAQNVGVPLLSCESWEGKLYCGTDDGRVVVNTGYIDGVTLADPDSFTPVQWSALQSFQSLGNTNQKQVVMMRPEVLCESSPPNFTCEARYDYDLQALAPVAGDAAMGGDLWDSAIWDAAVWGGSLSPTEKLLGAAGMGRNVAVVITGTAVDRTVWVSTEVMFNQGGPP